MGTQERVNTYWQKLGDKYGFKPNGVAASSKGKLFFLAEPKPIVKPKTDGEIEMEKYDSLKKIVSQLEFCNYETKDNNHSLEMNVAFKKLKQLAETGDL